MKALMTAADVADYLGIKKCATYEILRREDFPVISFGRRKYVLREDLDTWILNQRRCPPDRH